MALERLAVLEHEAGRSDEAARLRRAIPAIDRDRKEYIRLLTSESPEVHGAELAQLAERLGRHFDAVRWAALDVASKSKDAIEATAKVPARATPESPAGPTLADLLAKLEGSAKVDAGQHTSTRSSPMSVPKFTDDALAVGLNFVHENGGTSGRMIPPVTASGGVGLLDFDNDGWLDVYLVQGGPFPPDPRVIGLRRSLIPKPARRHFRGRDRSFRHRCDGARLRARGRGG